MDLLECAIDGEVDQLERVFVSAVHAGAGVDVPDRCLAGVVDEGAVFGGVGNGRELADLDGGTTVYSYRTVKVNNGGAEAELPLPVAIGRPDTSGDNRMLMRVSRQRSAEAIAWSRTSS